MVNNVEVTQRCLDHIRANTPPIYELILVADDSTPETLSWLMGQHMYGARLVLNRERQNFSGAVNMGIKVSRGRYIAIVTNDVYVRPRWLEPLIQALKQMPALGWVSAQIVQPDGVFRPFNIACCLIDREAIERAGLLDEAFRQGKGFEDDDWYWRFLKVGYRPHGVRQSVADHPETETTFRSFHDKDRLLELSRKGQEIFYSKWGFMGTNWLAIPSLDIQTLDRFEWLRRNAEGGILDLGSAGGHTFPSDRFDVVNLDIDLYRIPNFVRGDGHSLPFKDESFDTVALGDVMEHVDDPVQVMREAKRVGKKVIMTIPNEVEVPSTGHPLMSTVYKQGAEVHREAIERWIRDNRPLKIVDDVEYPHLFHKRFYTEEMLQRQLEEARLNYRLDSLEYWVPNPEGRLEHLKFFIVEAT